MSSCQAIAIAIEGVSTIPDECMEVGLEINASNVLGNEAFANRSGRLSKDRTHSQHQEQLMDMILMALVS